MWVSAGSRRDSACRRRHRGDRIAGPASPQVSRAAFTILEILLALAVIGLLSAVLVSGASHLVSGRAMTPDEIFWEASREARRTALKTDREVRLSFDPKEKHFVVDDGRQAKTFPLLEPPRELTVDFLPVRSTSSAVLIGGQLVESESVKSVTFYPDGTCVPFRVQFRTTGPARVITIDPWTCAPILPRRTTPDAHACVHVAGSVGRAGRVRCRGGRSRRRIRQCAQRLRSGGPRSCA
jgi:general secretion pathway protein H